MICCKGIDKEDVHVRQFESYIEAEGGNGTDSVTDGTTAPEVLVHVVSAAAQQQAQQGGGGGGFSYAQFLRFLHGEVKGPQ